MRGKLLGRVLDDPADRIIPAHAGQTGRVSPCRNPCSDHPRACGANRYVSPAPMTTCGSSPRMRGKLIRDLDGDHRVRIIPAHAGQTPKARFAIMIFPDHPRACGANLAVRRVDDAVHGSSPRMRGKPAHCRCSWQWRRIIPAHAGQT